jgi:uncharacterized OB-fold protein
MEPKKELVYPSKLDKALFGKLAGHKILIKCCNGHYNTTVSKYCWKCNACLNLTAVMEQTETKKIDNTHI